MIIVKNDDLLLFQGRMLSRDYRLKLTEICCKIKLKRHVTLDEMIWKQKLCDANKHAAGIAERFTS